MKYGIKTMLRFPIRSFMFFLLIGAASLFLSLGMSVWFSAQSMLVTADESCITAGEVVFQGGGYPDAGTFDPTLAEIADSFDLIALGSLPGALLAEDNYEHRAYVKSGTLKKNETSYSGFALLEVDVVAPMPNKDYFLANIRKVHYSADTTPTGSLYLYPDESGSSAYKTGHTYLVSGNITMLVGIPLSGMLPQSYTPVVLAAGGPAVEYPSTLDISDYTEQEMQAFWESETGHFYHKLTEMVQTVQNSVSLVASADIDSVEPFHKGEYTLLEGRLFSEQDYETGDTCLIPARLAENLGLALGDIFDLGVHRSVNKAGVYASYWPDVGFAYEGSYQIAGIYQTTDRNTPVYIPDAGQTWLAHSGNDYVLGRVVVQNGMSDAFLSAAKPLLPVGVTLRLYDQGYGHLARSLAGMEETAQVIIFVSAAVCLVILVFFGFLFVSRQAASVSILVGLGTSAGRIRLFFLSGVGIVTVLATMVGGLGAYFISDGLTNRIWEASQSPDRRFSLSGNSLQIIAPEPEIALLPFFLTAALVIGSALLICAVCLLLVLRSQNARIRMRKVAKKLRQKEKKVNAPRKALGASISSALPGHALRYGVRTMLRGRLRALVTLLVFAVLFCAVGVMDSLRTSYESSLVNAYEEIPVTVHFTDSRGRMIDRLSILPTSAEKLASYEFAADSWVSRNALYHYAGLSQENGEEASWVIVPEQNTFAYETFRGQMNTRFSPLVMSSAPAYTKNHFHSGAPDIQWAPGYDLERYHNSVRWVPVEDMATGYSYYEQEGMPLVLVSEAFLTAHDVALGDSIYMQYFWEHVDGLIIDHRSTVSIAGVYSGGLLPETVYITSNFIFPGYSLHAGGILLKDVENLDGIREQLSKDFSEPLQINGNRVWIYINDTELVKTVDNLERYIGYLNYLQPVMLAVAVGLGFLTANLALRTRRREIALLRSVGTGRISVFFSLYWEQLLLCVPGVLLGYLGVTAITGQWVLNMNMDLGILTLCFLFGAAVAIIQTQRVVLIQNLLERE